MSPPRAVFYIVVVTLAAMILGVVGVMLAGLFDNRVDNQQVFAIIGPAFNMVIGSFVGILGGHALGRADRAASDKEPSNP